MTTTTTFTTSTTGTDRSVGPAAEFGVEGKWITSCDTHGVFASSATRVLAEAADTVEFCDECRAMVLRVDDLVWVGRGQVTYRVVEAHDDGTFTIESIDGLNVSLTKRLPAARLQRQTHHE